jgi:hypothetical protein
MSTPWPAITGPSYQLSNPWAAIERTINWIPVPNEASREEKKFDLTFEPTPGNFTFGTVPSAFPYPARGRLEYRGRVFGVNGNRFFEILPTGVEGQRDGGQFLQNDGKPVCMVGNGSGQIWIESGGMGYVFNTNTNLFNPITDPNFLGASFSTMQDGYILNIVPETNQFQISGSNDVPVGDATLWDAANVSAQLGQGDLLQAIFSRREYLRILGYRRSQIYYNAGGNGIGLFPFQSYNETFIETGIEAPFSLNDLGDSLIWIGLDERGRRAAWRDFAFQPQRVSTFPIEQFWDSYPKISDAVSFTYIWNGHLIWQTTFPSGTTSYGDVNVGQGATWCYDVTASAALGRPIWFERTYVDFNGKVNGRPEQFHCFAFGKHLVGSTGLDGFPGVTWQYSAPAYNSGIPFVDQGDTTGAGVVGNMPIVRDRICPHLWGGYKRIIYNRLELECARGVGLDGGSAVLGSNPGFLLRWSDNSGQSFGRELPMTVGKLGDFDKRVYLTRLGYARGRVFWLRYSDPTYQGLVSGMLDFIPLAS